MSTNRFDPMKEFSNFRDQVSKVLEDTFSVGNTSVPVDVYETEDTLVLLSGALLGLRPDSLDISIKDGITLTVEGETVPPTDVPDAQYIKRERKFGRFSRTVTLPVRVIAEQAKANYKDGVVRITLPKAERTSPKVVKVTPLE
jgi:HSP20 family protein